MGSKIQIDVNKIKASISKQIGSIAKKAGEEIQEAYKSSISNFYESYNNTSYVRTFSLFTGSSAYGGRPTCQKLGQMRYSCGIVASPAYYDGNPYAKSQGIFVTPQLVWKSAFSGGMHGVIGGHIAAVTESPESIMDGQFQRIKGQVSSALGNLTFDL